MIRVFDDFDKLCRGAADYFVECARAAAGSKGRFQVALSGGSTPRSLYELLATPEYARAVPWSSVEVFFGDERFVPSDDPDSNEHMARLALLANVPIPDEAIHPMARGSNQEAAATAYNALLRSRFEGQEGLDLALLGLGTDGHTASIFPCEDGLWADGPRARSSYAPVYPHERITMSPDFLARSERALFLVSGANKAQPLADALAGVNLPASRLARALGDRATWFVDRAAAALVPKELLG